jgi:nitrogen fixation NifU-like protein
LSANPARAGHFAGYSDAVLDHFQHPRNAGELPGATASVEVSNPVCGDVLRLAVIFSGDRITEARFLTCGCVAAIAASSLLTELLCGHTRAEARAITPERISGLLGELPPASFHAADLAADGVAALLRRLG